MLKKLSVLVLAIAMVVALTSCLGGNDESGLVGKWVSEEGTVLTFNADGTGALEADLLGSYGNPENGAPAEDDGQTGDVGDNAGIQPLAADSEPLENGIEPRAGIEPHAGDIDIDGVMDDLDIDEIMGEIEDIYKVEFKWSVDDGILTLEVEEDGETETQTFTYTLDGDTLTITENGETTTFTRAND